MRQTSNVVTISCRNWTVT